VVPPEENAVPETQTQTTQTNTNRFRGQLNHLQARIGTLEAEARGRLRKALGKGNGALLGLDEALARVSTEDWSVDGLRKRIDTVRARAENLRAAALKRVADMPGSAVSALATSSRAPVQNLARELERLAKRLDPADLEKH
jgi:tetrahydromethanopterin S-methyltransferase subunit G